MPKIIRVIASYSRTVNIGNFHSIRLESTVEAEVEAESHREALRGLHTMVKEETEAKIEEKLGEIKEERDAIFSHAVSEPRKRF
jgi:hypothetical protein